MPGRGSAPGMGQSLDSMGWEGFSSVNDSGNSFGVGLGDLCGSLLAQDIPCPIPSHPSGACSEALVPFPREEKKTLLLLEREV